MAKDSQGKLQRIKDSSGLVKLSEACLVVLSDGELRRILPSSRVKPVDRAAWIACKEADLEDQATHYTATVRLYGHSRGSSGKVFAFVFYKG